MKLYFFHEAIHESSLWNAKKKKFQLAECNIKVKGSLPLHLSKVQIKLNLYREWECTFLPKKCRSEREQNFFSSLAKPWCRKRFFLAWERKSLSLIWNVKINFGHLLRKMSAVPIITNAEADKTMFNFEHLNPEISFERR